MGDASAAVGGDAQSIFTNPAGLAVLRGPELGSMFAPQGQDQRLWAVSYANPLGRWGTLGAGALMQQIGDIEGRQNEFDLPSQTESREGAFLLSYAGSPVPGLTLGVTAKYLFQNFSNLPDQGHGSAADIGARFHPYSRRDISFGLTAQNLGGRFSWSTGKTDPLLFSTRVGAAWQAASWLLLAADLQWSQDNSLRGHGGMEAAYSLFRLRAGADHDKPTLGFGLVTPQAKVRFRFDYAFEIDPKGLEDISRFGFSWRF